MIKQISFSQKKIIIMVSVGLVAFLIPWFLVYLPTKNAVGRAKKELAAAETQIRQIEAIVDKAKNMEEGLTLLQGVFAKINNKFPRQEEESLAMLSDYARKLNIEVVSIKPSAKEFLFDEDGQKIGIECKFCQRLAVSLELRCSYKDLVGYLEALKKEVTAYISIEKLRINKDSLGPAKLSVILDINLYLLS